MNTSSTIDSSSVNAHTLDGGFFKKTVQQKNGQYVLNIGSSVDDRKQIIRVIQYLFGPIKGVGTVKSAGKDKFVWVPGPSSQEANAIPRLVTLPALLSRLNEAQKEYRFELVYGTLLRIKILNPKV